MDNEIEAPTALKKPEKSKETVPIEFSPIRLASKTQPLPVSNIRLDELVICSPQGGLIKNVGGMNPSRRVDLLELFSIKMRQISARPEWGVLEYLTIQGKDYTATVEFPDGMGTFGLVRRKGVPANPSSLPDPPSSKLFPVPLEASRISSPSKPKTWSSLLAYNSS